jgi:hypothetical protein
VLKHLTQWRSLRQKHIQAAPRYPDNY